MARLSAGEKVCWTAALAFLCGITLLPVGYMVVLSLRGESGIRLDAYAAVLKESRQWVLLRSSLGIAGGAALLATVLGAPAGFALEYLRVPTRRTLWFCLAVPLLIPPYISTIAWIDLLGRQGMVTSFLQKSFGLAGSPVNVYTPFGVILVLALCYFPIVTTTTGLAVRRVDRRIEEAAMLAVSKSQALRSVTIPLLMPGVLTGSVVVFLLSLVNFGVPSLLQVNVYPVEIYTRFNAFHDFRQATAMAVPLLLAAVAVLGCATFIAWRKQYWFAGAGRQNGAYPATCGRWLGTAVCWLLVFVSLVLPMAALVRGSLPVSSYALAWKTAKSEMAQSLAIAALAATGLVLVGFALSYWMRRRGVIASAAVHGSALLPFAISGPVLGIGLILLWNRPGLPGAVYGSLAIVVLAVVTKFVFFAEAGIGVALRHMHPNLEDAAAVAGVPSWRRITGILVPLTFPSLVAVWGLGFVLALQELDVTVLVCPPGVTPLPIRLFTLMHYGPSRLVSALCVLMVCVVLLSVALIAGVYLNTQRMRHVRD